VERWFVDDRRVFRLLCQEENKSIYLLLFTKENNKKNSKFVNKQRSFCFRSASVVFFLLEVIVLSIHATFAISSSRMTVQTHYSLASTSTVETTVVSETPKSSIVSHSLSYSHSCRFDY
jgi:hypothetical protein